MTTKSKNVERVIFSTYYNESVFNECKNHLADHLNVPLEDVDDERVWDEYNTMQRIDVEDFENILYELNKRAAHEEGQCFNNHFALVGKAQTWRGTFSARKPVELQKLLTSLGSDIESIKVYAEGKRIYVQASHHDGTHKFELRQKRDNVSVDVYHEGIAVSEDCVLNRTKSTYPLFAEYYGW